MKLSIIFLLLFISISLNGCATYFTQFDKFNGIDSATQCNEMNIYSGAIADGAFISFMPLIKCHGEGCAMVFVYPLLFVGALVDLPFSIAADTIILPYTIYSELSLDCKPEKQKSVNRSEVVIEKTTREAKAKKSVPSEDAPVTIVPNNQ